MVERKRNEQGPLETEQAVAAYREVVAPDTLHKSMMVDRPFAPPLDA